MILLQEDLSVTLKASEHVYKTGTTCSDAVVFSIDRIARSCEADKVLDPTGLQGRPHD